MCYLQAFNSLGEAAYDAAPVPEEEEEPQTYALSTWFPQIVEKLLAVTDRYVQSIGTYRFLTIVCSEALTRIVFYVAVQVGFKFNF